MSLDSDKLRRIIEAALFAAGRPLNIDKIGKLFEEDERPSNPDIKQALAELLDDYKDRGVNLVEVASGWRFQSRQEFAIWLQRLWEERPAKYSRASLETLSLIAYRQPVTRGEIEEIRGVSVSSNIIKSMLEREWIRVVGHRDVPGRPALFATTKNFLDYFNLKSLEDLPTLSEIKDLESLNPQLDLKENSSTGQNAEESTDENADNNAHDSVDEKLSSAEGNLNTADEDLGKTTIADGSSETFEADAANNLNKTDAESSSDSEAVSQTNTQEIQIESPKIH